MSRILASIQKIVNIQSIPGADKIVQAQVLGWKCITAIDNGISIGDFVVYFEIDSRLNSEDKRFAFMEKRNWKVKTLKMRGVYSQGLIIPLKDFPEIKEPKEGMDVTNLLKVIKIDSDEPGERDITIKKQHPLDRLLCKFKIYRRLRPYILNKRNKGWPVNIPHTDETRIQALWNVLSPLFQTNKKWYISTKIDGQSATYYYKKGLFKDFFGIYSRELRKTEDDNSNWSKVAKGYDIKEVLKRASKKYGNIWIQGEIAGPRIQRNKNRFTKLRFFVFNIYLVNKKRYMDPYEMKDFCRKYNLETVPLLKNDSCMSDILQVSLNNKTVDDLVEMSKGPSEWSKDDLREGIVIREMEDLSINRISFKVINPEFCIKYNL